MPNVSVIIPAYNAEAFIADTVQSVLDQTYQDFEIIVVDDGSKDGTVAALEPFGSRVHVHTQTNGGVARARNAGVALASGEFIAFLDADDLWLPQKLERQPEACSGELRFTARNDWMPSRDSMSCSSTTAVMIASPMSAYAGSSMGAGPRPSMSTRPSMAMKVREIVPPRPFISGPQSSSIASRRSSTSSTVNPARVPA